MQRSRTSSNHGRRAARGWRDAANGYVVAAVVTAGCISCSSAVSSSSARAVDVLVAVDRGFAERAARTNLVDGTLAMLDDSAVYVRPGVALIRGRAAVQAYLEDPERRAAAVSWKPESSGVSKDRTQGYTAGTLNITWPDGRFDPGIYIAYWRLVAGRWRVVAYRRTARQAGQPSCAGLLPDPEGQRWVREDGHQSAAGDLGYVVGVREETDTTSTPHQTQFVRHLCVWRADVGGRRVVVATR